MKEGGGLILVGAHQVKCGDVRQNEKWETCRESLDSDGELLSWYGEFYKATQKQGKVKCHV